MNANTATEMIASAKTTGRVVSVTLTDNTIHTGLPVSVNSKGVNIKVDGKVRSFALGRVRAIGGAVADTALPTGSPAEVAPYFNLSAKELRVVLRALGMGVGKGRRHVLDTGDVKRVADHLANA